MPPSSLWLGTPSSKKSEPDAYSCFIGGQAVWMRATKGSPDTVLCPKCSKTDGTLLLAQLYVPLDCFDRSIYIFCCKHCGEKECSYMFALRCQNFVGVETSKNITEAAKPEESGPMFAEDDDWGDEDDDTTFDVQPSRHDGPIEEHVPEEPVIDCANHEAAKDLCTSNLVASKSAQLPRIHLDIFEYDDAAEDDCGTLEEQLREADAKCPGSGEIDMTGEEEDDDSLEQKMQNEFMDRLGSVPSQVVRWQPNSEPLLFFAEDQDPGACSHCGAPRRFECQLMPPLVYFLTKHLGEDKNDIHFGTAALYTCSANCYAQNTPYMVEKMYVQREF